MTPESSNNMDLIKSQLGLSNVAPLEQAAKGLAAQKSQGSDADKKRWKAALDFESMFLSNMYKNMRQSTLAEGNSLTEASPGREIFTDMLDNQYASLNSKNPLVAGDQGMQNAIKGVSNSLAAQIYRSLARAEGQQNVSAPASLNKTVLPSIDQASADDESGDDMFSVAPVLANIMGKNARSGKSSAAPSMSDEQLKPIIDLASQTYGVDANLIQSVIKTESNNQPDAVSNAGAKGLMQLMDTTSSDMGVKNPFNAHENVLAGTKYLKQLLVRYDGDETKALAAYNAGPANVDRFKGVPPYAETVAYVGKVLSTKQTLDNAQGGN